MAVRAGAQQPIEVDASHSIALSQPKAVADDPHRGEGRVGRDDHRLI
jgi:hypothetical protein